MALPHAFDKIIERVRRILSDTEKVLFSDEELRDYINEAQREFCEKTRILRAEGPLTTQENSKIFNLPDDCFIVDYIARADGHMIVKTSSRDLLNNYGTRFHTCYGNPEFYYQDMDGQKQVRFYPIPTESVLASFQQFDSELGAIIASDSVTIEPIIVDGVEIYDEDDPLYIAAATAETFDSELGAVVDSSIPDAEGLDNNNFTSELGAVTAVMSTEGVYQVFYIRYPQENLLEIDDIQAMQYYCLHKCYEKDSPVMNLKISIHNENKFQERVSRETMRVSSAQHASMATRGVYG
jgi:hypothetical protein